MYKLFRRNLNSFFELNREGSTDEFRIKIAQVLRGFQDVNLYKKWEIEDKDKYQEINNLVYEINRNTSRYRTFDTFSWDLWGYAYKADKSDNFSEETIEEQLKLIDLCLTTQYWYEV